MLKQVVLAENPLDVETYKRYYVDNVLEFIMTKYEEWPQTARLYHKSVSLDCDVTPSTEADIDRINEMEGPFFVVAYPGDPMTWLIAAVIVIAVASVAAAFLLRPNIPKPAQRNTQSPSPNNELSERTNQPRLFARIPDIYGTTRSTPDLISIPYKLFMNHQEVELSYMCIGRGSYDVSDIRDDKTLCDDIIGTSIEVYGPNTSPNSGEPQLTIGAAINTPLLNVYRSNSVNGQVLRAPNDQIIHGNDNVWFQGPNKILGVEDQIDFTKKFEAGDLIKIAGAYETSGYTTEVRNASANSDGSLTFVVPEGYQGLYIAGHGLSIMNAEYYEYELSGNYIIDSVTTTPEDVFLIDDITGAATVVGTQYRLIVYLVSPASVNPQWSAATGMESKVVTMRLSSGAFLYNLDGVYTILSVSAGLIVLNNPSSVNSYWATVGTTSSINAILSTTGPKWVGPFTLDTKNLSKVFVNLVALNGLYKDDGQTQMQFDVELELELTPVNNLGVATGAAETFRTTIEGSSTFKSVRAVTLQAEPTFTGKCKVRARRITQSDLTFSGQVVDEVKWRDLYSVSDVEESHFGDVTTVQSMVYATSSALTVKERKLNMLVTRKLPARVSGSTFSTILYPTNNVADILSAICLDPFIGNRNASEIDFDSIYDTAAEIADYFGTEQAAQFCYTFDKDNLSFEETVVMIANAVFSTAYRRGNQIKLSFEKETADSTLLFNHRNKLPGSETRTITFGNDNDNDGVEFTYVDPEDDAIVTLYLPEDRSAINPVKVESIGIRSKLQAWFHAWRIWNKTRYQNVTTEFEATQEASILILKDRILVADNTRPDTQDGEVISQNVLNLRLSQEIDFTKYSSYVIFLQHFDGTTETIGITPGATSFDVVLAHAPRLELALDYDLYARTTYVIVGNNEHAQKPFLVTEKTAHNNFTSIVKAINYDDRYYSNDVDYLNEIVDINGQRI